MGKKKGHFEELSKFIRDAEAAAKPGGDESAAPYGKSETDDLADRIKRSGGTDVMSDIEARDEAGGFVVATPQSTMTSDLVEFGEETNMLEMPGRAAGHGICQIT